MVSLASLGPVAQNLVWRSVPHKAVLIPTSATTYCPIRKCDLPGGLSDSDLLGIIGKYLLPSQVRIGELEKAISSSVYVSWDMKCREPGSSGVIVSYRGNKYLAMAYHTAAHWLARHRPAMNLLKRVNGRYEVFFLDNIQLVSLTPEPHGDVALFKYAGNIEGVELAEPLVEGEVYQSFAIGFPSFFQRAYKENLNPLLSFGFVVRDSNATDGHGWQPCFSIPDKYNAYYRRINLSPLLFSGITTGGNSGCGLFNLEGKLIGICHGKSSVDSTTDKEPKLFYSVNELFESLL